MAYTIIKTDGTTLGTVSDGTINNDLCSLTLIGRNYPNYGQIVANDFVALLENFSDGGSPDHALRGQLWWDKANSILKVCYDDDQHFKVVGSAYPSTIAPTDPILGDFWWDTANKQLYVYDSTTWVLIGPERNDSGAKWERIWDTSLAAHDILSLKLDGVRTAIICLDPDFIPNVTIQGFSLIRTGINANTSISSGSFWGLANNSSYLGGFPSSNYFRTNTDNLGTGNLRVQNSDGVTIGANLDLKISVSDGDTYITNRAADGDIALYTNVTGLGVVQSLLVSGTTGNVSVVGKPVTALGVATKSYVDDSFTNSPSLGGNPTAPTPAVGDNDTSIATTEFVYQANIGLKGYVDLANSIQSQQISLRANIAGPTFTGTVSAPTPTVGDNSTKVATTEFVQTANVVMKSYVDYQDSLKANINSPTFTGIPTANTAAPGTSTTQLATTEFVAQANVGLQGYIDLGNTIQSQQISLRSNIASPVFTGNPQAPTPSPGDNDTSIATTAFVQTANLQLKTYTDSQLVLKANIASPTFTGLARAVTMPMGTANTTIATTEFVINNSGLYPYKIYDNNTWMWVNDTGTGSANIVVDGRSILTGTPDGIDLKNGATAVTQTQTYTDSGNARVATTQFVKTATQWWGGSAKFVSTDEPQPGINDVGSNDGDFWFQREP